MARISKLLLIFGHSNSHLGRLPRAGETWHEGWTGAAVTMQASITQYLGTPKRTPCPQQQSCAPASTRGAKTEKWEQNLHIHIFGLIASALSCILEREGLLANSAYSYFITVPRQQYICMWHHIATADMLRKLHYILQQHDRNVLQYIHTSTQKIYTFKSWCKNKMAGTWVSNVQLQRTWQLQLCEPAW